jgi:hypothetical protein
MDSPGRSSASHETSALVLARLEHSSPIRHRYRVVVLEFGTRSNMLAFIDKLNKFTPTVRSKYFDASVDSAKLHKTTRMGQPSSSSEATPVKQMDVEFSSATNESGVKATILQALRSSRYDAKYFEVVIV